MIDPGRVLTLTVPGALVNGEIVMATGLHNEVLHNHMLHAVLSMVPSINDRQPRCIDSFPPAMSLALRHLVNAGLVQLIPAPETSNRDGVDMSNPRKAGPSRSNLAVRTKLGDVAAMSETSSLDKYLDGKSAITGQEAQSLINQAISRGDGTVDLPGGMITATQPIDIRIPNGVRIVVKSESTCWSQIAYASPWDGRNTNSPLHETAVIEHRGGELILQGVSIYPVSGSDKAIGIRTIGGQCVLEDVGVYDFWMGAAVANGKLRLNLSTIEAYRAAVWLDSSTPTAFSQRRSTLKATHELGWQVLSSCDNTIA